MAEPEKTGNMTVEDYLKFEDASTIKHEYVRGQIFAMTGATQAHVAICANFLAFLHGCLRGSGCRVFQSDMKVRVEEMDCFYYPDIMVTCEPFNATSVYTTSPVVIAEVLSPSTKQIDRREKLVAYRLIDSLRQYILVHQNRMLVEVQTRLPDGQWALTMLDSGDKLLVETLPGKAVSIPVSEIYADVEIPPFVKEAEEDYETCHADFVDEK